MSDNWELCTLDDVLELIIDHRGKTPAKLGGDFTDAGVRVVSAIHIKKGRIKWDERERYVTEDMYHRWMPEKLREGDVLLTSEAPLGEVTSVPDNIPTVLSQRLFALRGKADRIDNRFLRYFLESPRGQQELQMRASGSTVSGIRQAELRKIALRLPPLPVQRAIAEVLGSLDDLCDTNTSLSADIETLLRVTFERLNFDIADDVSRLSDFIQIDPKLSVPKAPLAPYIDMAMLPTVSALVSKPQHRKPSGGRKFQNGDTLIARITPCLENGKTAFIDCLEEKEVGIGSTEYICLRAPSNVPSMWTYFLARSSRFREYAIRNMNGTSGRQRCSAEAISEYPIALPDEESLQEFGRIAGPMQQALRDLLDETEEARNTRDTLLPLLLSGKITPTNAAKLLEGV